MVDVAKVSSAMDVYLGCLKGRETAEDSVQKALTQLRSVAGSSTFQLPDGSWYQIRERKGKLYLCELDGKPKGRPKKTTEQKAHDKAEREAKAATTLRLVKDEEASRVADSGATVAVDGGGRQTESGEHSIPVMSDYTEDKGPSLGD